LITGIIFSEKCRARSWLVRNMVKF
jgi:hypothetical protein